MTTKGAVFGGARGGHSGWRLTQVEHYGVLPGSGTGLCGAAVNHTEAVQLLQTRTVDAP